MNATDSSNEKAQGDAYDAMLGLHKTARKIIATTPQGKAALYAHDHAAQAKKLQKLQTHGASPQTRAAATLLSKAKKGDPKARRDVAALHRAAQAGNPKARRAVLRLKAVDAATRAPAATPVPGRGRLYDGSHPPLALPSNRHRAVRVGCDKC